jgi:hypothetical protein
MTVQRSQSSALQQSLDAHQVDVIVSDIELASKPIEPAELIRAVAALTGR